MSPMTGETKRQIEHVAPIAFCLLLRDLPYPFIIVLSILAIVYGAFGKNLLVKGTHRETELKRGYSLAKIAYAVSVFLLLTIFRGHLYIAGGAWTIMAFGDAFSNLVGRRWGRHKIPWRHDFSFEGSAAFVITAIPTTFLMMLFISSGRATETLTPLTALYLSLIAVIAGAITETVSYKVDDNFTVPLGSGVVLWGASRLMGII